MKILPLYWKRKFDKNQSYKEGYPVLKFLLYYDFERWNSKD